MNIIVRLFIILSCAAFMGSTAAQAAFIRINCPVGGNDGGWIEVSGQSCWQLGTETQAGIMLGVRCVGGGQVATRFCHLPARCPNFLTGCGSDNSWADDSSSDYDPEDHRIER